MSTPMKKYSTPAYIDGENGETVFGSVDVYLASEVDALIAQENATQIAAGTIAQQGQRIAELERENSELKRQVQEWKDWLAGACI